MVPVQQKSASDRLGSGSASQIEWDLAKQRRQLLMQVQVVHDSCRLHLALWLSDMDTGCWLWQKDPGFWDQVPEDVCGAGLPSLWVFMRPFWQRPEAETRRVVRGCLMSWQLFQKTKQNKHLSWQLEIWATQQSAEIMLDGTIWKTGCPCPCLNFSRWLPAEKTARGVLLNRSSFVLDDPVGRTTWLTWTDNELPWRQRQMHRSLDRFSHLITCLGYCLSLFRAFRSSRPICVRFTFLLFSFDKFNQKVFLRAKLCMDI